MCPVYSRITIAEALSTGYSISQYVISDLGVGPAALIWNSSLFLLGVLVTASAYFLQRGLKSKLFSVPVALAGIGFVGTSLFTLDPATALIHFIFSLINAFPAIFAIIYAYKFVKPPLSYFTIVLGVVALVAFFLFLFGFDLCLGAGGIQRIINYPTLAAVIGFGAHLIGDSSDISTTDK